MEEQKKTEIENEADVQDAAEDVGDSPASPDSEGRRHLGSAERQRIYRERAEARRQAERAAKKKAAIVKIALISTAAVILIATAITLILCSINIWMPDKKYNNATSLYESGEYLKAYDCFVELGDYKDSLALAESCIIKNAQALSGKDDVVIGSSDDMPWFDIDEDGAISFDAELYRGDDDIVIPDVFDGVLVRKIANKAFEFFDEMKTLTIPASVTEIGERAFFSCDSLSELTLSDNVVKLGNYAFSDCVSLKSVTLGDGLVTIGQRAFRGCVELQSISIPEGVREILPRAFNGCDKLSSVTLPSTLTTIGANAFTGCKKLENVTYNGTEDALRALCINEDGKILYEAKGLVCTK